MTAKPKAGPTAEAKSTTTKPKEDRPPPDAPWDQKVAWPHPKVNGAAATVKLLEVNRQFPEVAGAVVFFMASGLPVGGFVRRRPVMYSPGAG